MCVGPVSGVGGGGGGISPLLIEQYKRLNREMKKKRLEAKEGVDPLIGDLQPRVEPFEYTVSPEELRQIYSHPLSARIPIKVAYTIIQRLSDFAPEDRFDTEALKLVAWRMYGGN